MNNVRYIGPGFIGPMLLIMTFFIVVLITTLTVIQHHSDRLACEAKDGEMISVNDSHICVKKGTVLR